MRLDKVRKTILDQRRSERQDRRPDRPHASPSMAGVEVPETHQDPHRRGGVGGTQRGVCPREAVPGAGYVQGQRPLTRPWPRRSGWWPTAATATPPPCTSTPTETEKLAKHAAAMKTCRILINTPVLPGRHRRPVQLQAGSLPDPGLRLLGRQLGFRKRGRQASAQHQNRG